MDSTSTEFLIVTGMSGAGKTQAMKAVEDLGFFCIDNLPPMLLPQLVDIHLQERSPNKCFAVAMDTRGRECFRHLFEALDQLAKKRIRHTILFLD